MPGPRATTSPSTPGTGSTSSGDFSGTPTDFNPWDPAHPDLHTNHYSRSGPRYFVAFLSSFNADGSLRWVKSWGGVSDDFADHVAIDGAPAPSTRSAASRGRPTSILAMRPTAGPPTEARTSSSSSSSSRLRRRVASTRSPRAASWTLATPRVRTPPPSALAPSVRRLFTITGGSCGVPADAVAVSTNVSFVNGGAAGDLRILPEHLTRSTTSVLSIRPGRTRANNTILHLAADGGGTISVIDASTAPVDFLLDVSGWFR